NQPRYERINALVIGDAGADAIGQCHVAGPIGAYQTSDAELTIAPKRQGIEEIVVHAAVEHVHLAQARRGPHANLAVVEAQVAALDQFDTHLAGEETVLEVCRVVQARGQHGDGRLVHSGRGDGAEHGRQVGGVVVHRTHVVAAEERGKDLLHHLAVLEDVTDAGRSAAVVLQYEVFAGRGADQVDARDVDVHGARHGQADRFAPVARGAEDQFGRHDAVLEHLPAVVDVVDEEVEGANALLQAAFHVLPLAGRDGAGGRGGGGAGPGALRGAGDGGRGGPVAP